MRPDEELRVGLEQLLAQRRGQRVRIARLTCERSAYSTSSPIDVIHLELADGEQLSLVRKDLAHAALLEGARRVKPRSLHDPHREIGVYERILQHGPDGAASYLGTILAPERDRFWLLLEHVDGVALWQLGELHPWQATCRWIAEFHLALAPHVPQIGTAVSLIQQSPTLWCEWLDRAQAATTGTDAAHAMQPVARAHATAVEVLSALPVTVMHGELYPSNVLVAPRGAGQPDGGLRVCPIDWEMAAVGPGLLDLAALVAGGWSEERRQVLIDAYRDAVPAVEGFDQALDACRLQLCVQWLGWGQGWQPPPEHAHAWMTEAVMLADRMTG